MSGWHKTFSKEGFEMGPWRYAWCTARFKTPSWNEILHLPKLPKNFYQNEDRRVCVDFGFSLPLSDSTHCAELYAMHLTNLWRCDVNGYHIQKRASLTHHRKYQVRPLSLFLPLAHRAKLRNATYCEHNHSAHHTNEQLTFSTTLYIIVLRSKVKNM